MGALAQLTLFDSPLSQLPLQAVSKKKNKKIAASQLKALADDLEVIEHSLRIFYRNYFSQPARDRRLKREEKKKAALIAKYSK